jgi:hypothetical protein
VGIQYTPAHFENFLRLRLLDHPLSLTMTSVGCGTPKQKSGRHGAGPKYFGD